MRELFKQKTHIDPDYFLELVLSFLGQSMDKCLFSTEDTVSITFCLDEKYTQIGLIKVTKDHFEIQRLNSN